jgi:hypothetical protein
VSVDPARRMVGPRQAGQRPGLPTKPFCRADEVSPKQDSALVTPDQTTRFGHGGTHPQLCLSRGLHAVFECHAAAALGLRKAVLIVRGRTIGSAMRDEFASKTFLAVTVTGLLLLCSGLLVFALT